MGEIGARFRSSWGNVVDVIYRLPEGQFPPFVEVMYAHLGRIDVKQFQIVKRGQQIGTIGNVDGLYKAHLRWEVPINWASSSDRARATIRTDRWNRASLSKRLVRAARDALMKLVPKKDQQKWGSDLL